MLAEALAARFGARLVPEVARTYLDGRTDYSAADVIEIARMQVAAETAALAEGHSLLVCDTDLLVIRIWWEEKIGALPDELLELQALVSARAYLLAKPDLPWEPDPLRENPTDRPRLFRRYVSLLDRSPHPYGIVEGTGEMRLENALAAVQVLYPDLSG